MGPLLPLSQAFRSLRPERPGVGCTAQLHLCGDFCFTSLGSVRLKFPRQVDAVVSLLSVSRFTV